VHDVLIALAVIAATVASAGTFGFYLIARAVWRTNRVVPDRRTHAPISWLVSPREPARLHRRLRRTAQAANSSVAPLRSAPKRRQSDNAVSPLVQVADDLIAQAILLDDRLPQAASAAPQWRSPLLHELGIEVKEVEAAAGRLGRLAATWQMEMRRAAELPTPGIAPLELRSRLDAVEAALAELRPIGHAHTQSSGELTRPS
jgi:hypothetical protein